MRQQRAVFLLIVFSILTCSPAYAHNPGGMLGGICLGGVLTIFLAIMGSIYAERIMDRKAEDKGRKTLFLVLSILFFVIPLACAIGIGFTMVLLFYFIM